MSNEIPVSHTEPTPKAPTLPDDEGTEYEPEPDLTTPGGRFWELPLDPQETEALSFRGF
jgi:hypothetical protein